MSQVQVSNSSSNSNSNIDTSQTSVQELLNLVKSLYKIIEGLNARLEKFENELLSRVVSDKSVDKGVYHKTIFLQCQLIYDEIKH